MKPINLTDLDPVDLTKINRGIEKESLRVGPEGQISPLNHPKALGSALTHQNITTDFSEAQLELITDTHQSVDACLNQLRLVHQFVSRNIGDEYLWCASMPCSLPDDHLIPIATFGTSNIGTAKTVYRRGLSVRYGRKMQTISGIHFNFSLPENVWKSLVLQTGETVQETKTRNYFSLIRNFRRHAWILLYLFGASPAVCQCFVDGRIHHLNDMGHGTKYSPYATSLRMGPLGYQSDAQSSISVSFNSLGNYARSLFDALTQPHPPYAAIGIKQNDEFTQLSTSLLQIENEFYGTVRPKQPAQSGERPLLALNRRGVDYIEARCVDLDPYSDIGITRETIAFLDTFLMFCLLEDSPIDSADENLSNHSNQHLVAERGRDKSIRLNRDGRYISVKDWGQEIIEKSAAIAQRLDEVNNTKIHSEALVRATHCLLSPEQTPSAKVLHDIKENYDGSYFDFITSMSKQYTNDLKTASMSDEQHEWFMTQANTSIERQKDLEDSNEGDFDSFRENYVSQDDSKKFLISS
ncbi:MAG: glutamate--cysteine ligase [Betaproteobacteria bacterium]|jgi:glutamate--cysteine ligase